MRASQTTIFKVMKRIVQYNMSVRTTEAERVDADSTLSLGRLGHHLGGHTEAPALEIDLRVGSLEVHVRRNGAALKRQDGFDDAGETTASFRVADVRLDAANVERQFVAVLVSRTMGTEGVADVLPMAPDLQ